MNPLDVAWSLMKAPPKFTDMQHMIDTATNPEGAAELQRMHDEAMPLMQDREQMEILGMLMQTPHGKLLANHAMLKLANMAHPDLVPDELVYDKQHSQGVPEDTY